MNNPFTQRLAPNSPALALGGMTLLLGVLIGLAWVTNTSRPARLGAIPADVRNRLDMGATDLQEDMERLQLQIADLREQATKYEAALAKQSGQAKELNQALQDQKLASGLTEVVGPGVVVTLEDAQEAGKIDEAMMAEVIVHDYDILRIVNELWNAGAEAIAVNGQRVVTGTSIRCVGAVVRVNDVPLAPPFKIFAIGDGPTLASALQLPGGVVAEMKEVDPSMVKIDVVEESRVPAFSGSTAFWYGKLPGEPKK